MFKISTYKRKTRNKNGLKQKETKFEVNGLRHSHPFRLLKARLCGV